MVERHFEVRSHKAPCQFIREYPFATDGEQETELQLAVKQYIPLSNPRPKDGDITIIAAHAIGFGKECYEPLWIDLLGALEKRGVSIRSIWFADCANHGESYVLNEDKLGNEPAWQDHSRDLLLMVNHFRNHIKRPIIGVGHSIGGSNIVDLSILHPRLFTSLVLVEAALGHPNVQLNWYPSMASARRRDRWTNRAEARSTLLQNAFYRNWDPRVFDRYLASELRDVPTRLYPGDEGEEGVTLTTPRDQEVLLYLRPNLPTPTHPDPSEDPDRTVNPDVDPASKELIPFYCPGPMRSLHNLPHLRPSVLWIVGSKSPFSTKQVIDHRLQHTGVGVDGSGGAKHGQVRHRVLPGGHFLPFESVPQVAHVACEWIVDVLERWRRLESERRTRWSQIAREERQRMSKGALVVLSKGPTDSNTKL